MIDKAFVTGDVPKLRIASYGELSRAAKAYADLRFRGPHFTAFPFGSETLILNRELPKLPQLAAAVQRLMHCQWLDSDDDKGLRLLSEIEAIAGRSASDDIYTVWGWWRDKKAEAEADAEAKRFLSKIDPTEDEVPCDDKLLLALYSNGLGMSTKWANWGLRAVFLYAFHMVNEMKEKGNSHG